MARTVFSDDDILDAARAVVAQRGPRAVTLQTVAAAARATNGSIYHRFRSVDDLIARVWLRAARRCQEAALGVDADDDGVAVAVALAIYDFCLAEREDALLLGAFRPADLAALQLSPEVAAQLAEANAPVEGLLRDVARRTRGSARRADREVLELACIDVPYGFARRHLDGTTTPPPADRQRLEAAVRAVLTT